MNVKLPAVVDASKSAFFISAKKEVGAPMGTAGIDDSNFPIGITESNKVFAQQFESKWTGVRCGQLPCK